MRARPWDLILKPVNSVVRIKSASASSNLADKYSEKKN